MKRGVVVDKNDDFITLLTSEGQFLKANNQKGMYEIGEEISFFPLMNKSEETTTRESRLLKNRVLSALSLKKTRVGALSFLAIMFFVISFLPYINQNKAYAYMSIDINPSFEVKIDGKLNVFSLEPINEEAENLMKELPNWDGKSFVDVVNSIVTQSKSEGYVYPGKEILIATVVNQEDKQMKEKLIDNIEQIRHSIEEDKMIVKTIETDSETRDKAKKQGISTGKYVELTDDKKVDYKEEDAVKSKQQEDTRTKEIENTPVPVLPKANNNSEWKNETKERLKETQNKIKENGKSANQQRLKEEHKERSKEVRNNEKKDRKAEKEKQQDEKRGNKQNVRNSGNNHHKHDDDDNEGKNDENDKHEKNNYDEDENDKYNKEDD